MRSTETTRVVPVRSRSLLGLLTVGLLVGAPAFAQTAPGTPTPPDAPVTQPAPVAPPLPDLGLPATTPAPQDVPPQSEPPQSEPPQSEPQQSEPPQGEAQQPGTEAPVPDPTSTDGAAPVAPADAAPISAAGVSSSLPAPGSVKVPELPGAALLKTVQTVLGETLIYSAGTQDALPRTVEALQAAGYSVQDGAATSADRVTLRRAGDDRSFELSVREQGGMTVVSLARLPGRDSTEAPAPEAAPAPTDPAPAEPAPTEPETAQPDAAPAPAVSTEEAPAPDNSAPDSPVDAPVPEQPGVVPPAPAPTQP